MTDGEQSVGSDRPLDPWGREIPLARPVEGWTPKALPVRDCPQLLLGISRRRAALNLLLMIVAIGLVIAITSLVTYLIAGDAFAKDDDAISAELLIGMTLMVGFLLMVAAVIIVRTSGLPISAIGLGSRSWGVDILLGPAVTVASFIVFFIIVGTMMVVWPEGYKQLTHNPEAIDQMIPESFSMGGLMLMLLGIGIYEEVLFRGFLLSHLRRIAGGWTIAIIGAGILFAVMHVVGKGKGVQTPATIVPLFGVAVLWSVVTIWRKSLVPAIVGHMLFNAAQMIALRVTS